MNVAPALAPDRRTSPRRLEASLRRRRAVTARIQRAALELIAARGYPSVTVEGIAAAAGVSPRTFFRHFACKDDVVLDLQRQAIRRVCRVLERRPSDEGVVVALRSAMVAVSEVPDDDHELVLLHARVLAGIPALEAQAIGEHCSGTGPLVGVLGARMGVDPSSDGRPALLAATVAAAAEVAFARWAAGGGKGDPSAAVAVAVDAVLCGVGALVPA